MEDSHFLNRHEQIDIKKKLDLPHWEQTEKLQFVTFRLADSLPKSFREYIENRKLSFKKLHPEPWDEQTIRKYDAIASSTISKLLDNGLGACILSNQGARTILEDIIKHYDGKTYHLVAYVIMPNHVHLLFQPIDMNTVQNIIRTIKSLSSHKINKLFNRSGRLWNKEYYDRIIRDQSHLENVIEYIIGNPNHLSESDFALYYNTRYNPRS